MLVEQEGASLPDVTQESAFQPRTVYFQIGGRNKSLSYLSGLYVFSVICRQTFKPLILMIAFSLFLKKVCLPNLGDSHCCPFEFIKNDPTRMTSYLSSHTFYFFFPCEVTCFRVRYTCLIFHNFIEASLK